MRVKKEKGDNGMNVYYATCLEISMKRLKTKEKVYCYWVLLKKKRKVAMLKLSKKKKKTTLPALTLQKESPFNVLF